MATAIQEDIVDTSTSSPRYDEPLALQRVGALDAHNAIQFPPGLKVSGIHCSRQCSRR